MQAMSTIQGNLAAVAKEVDAAHRRASKLNIGKSSSNKVANATSDVEAANQQWESQAPYVFEQLQALDETRVNHLRDALTQLETHEVDQVERNRNSAESCLNALLSIDTSEEISTFVARVSGRTPTLGARPESHATSNSAAAASTSPEIPSAATPSRVRDQTSSDRSSPFSMSSRAPTGTFTSPHINSQNSHCDRRPANQKRLWGVQASWDCPGTTRQKLQRYGTYGPPVIS